MKQLLITIWRYLKPHKNKAYFLASLSLLAAGIASVVPLIYGWLVDQALSGTKLEIIGLGLLIWLILSLANNWFSRVIEVHSDNLSALVESKIIIDFADHFLHLPVSYLKDQKVGQMINKSDRAAMNMEHLIQGVVFDFIPDLITIFFILFILLSINWILSIVLFLVLFFYSVVTIWKSKKIVIVNKKVNKAYNEAYGDHYEYLSGYKTVRASSAESSMIRTMRSKFKRIIKTRWESELVWNNLSVWQESIFSFGFVGLFGLGVLMLGTGNVTAGNLVSFIGYIAFVFGVLGRLGNYYNTVNRTLAEVSGLDKILKVKRETETRSQKNLKKINNISGKVIFDNVSFKYKGSGDELVLKDLNFEVNQGEVIALVGESGAGKTTLIDLIFADYLPTKGRVLIDEYDTRKVDPKELRRHMAIVPQEVTLFHETISFNISYASIRPKQTEIEKIAKEANAHKFIMQFNKGYQSKVGERGVKLSVGQKQRIAIARALLSDPDILILDEATSSLDSVTEKEVQEALNRLIKGRTTFIIAHRLSTITHADRIFVLDQGRVVEIGKHQELLDKKGVYTKLYNAQKL